MRFRWRGGHDAGPKDDGKKGRKSKAEVPQDPPRPPEPMPEQIGTSSDDAQVIVGEVPTDRWEPEEVAPDVETDEGQPATGLGLPPAAPEDAGWASEGGEPALEVVDDRHDGGEEDVVVPPVATFGATYGAPEPAVGEALERPPEEPTEQSEDGDTAAGVMEEASAEDALGEGLRGHERRAQAFDMELAATAANLAVPTPEVGYVMADEADSEEEIGLSRPVRSAEMSQGGTRPLPRVLAVANQKGGVGKTTTTVNLGAALAELGYRVLVIDLDPQGNATTGLGIDARNFEMSMYDVIMREMPLEDCIEPTSVKNLFVAPATIDLAGVEIELVPAFSRELRLRRAVEGVVDDFDFVLIDCPPSLGLITINGLAAAGEVLVPIQCEYYALEGLSQLLRNVHLVAANLNEQLEVTTIVLTMYDGRTRLAVEVASEVRQHFAERVCETVIPRAVRLSEAPSFGQPITVFDPTSRGAVAYRDLAKEVSNGAPKRSG